MDWVKYLLVFVVVCAIYFVITRAWVGLIDLIVSGLKKLFRLNNNKPEKWHSLKDIKDKKQNNNP